jgi:membrane protease YdiL (CAAX protease family)
MDALRVGLLDCLAVAVIEELLFRGFPFQRLVAGIGAWPAQLLIAGYFTLTHSHGLATAGGLLSLAAANIFLASLLFGATYLRTRSLAIPIALHFALNFFQGPVLGFGVSGHTSGGWLVPVLDDAPQWWTGGSFGLEASVPGTLAIVAALAAITMHKEGTR